MKTISVGNIVTFKDTNKRFKIDEHSFEKVVVLSVSPIILMNEDGGHFWGNLDPDELFVVGEAGIDTLKKVLKCTSQMFLVRELWRKTIVVFLAEYGKSVELDCDFDPEQAMESLEGDISPEELQNISLTIIHKLTELKTINYISEKVDEITKQWGKKQKNWKKD